MIDNAFDLNQRRNLDFHAIEDRRYDDEAWVCQVQQVVEHYGLADEDVVLIGHSKDHSSYYLKLFPQWNSFNVEFHEEMSATTFRRLYFGEYGSEDFDDLVPKSTYHFLNKFWAHNPAYYDIRAEYKFINDYKDMWSKAPYPPTFVTVDAVVIQSGHILMVERDGFPGKGLWALPGGYLNQHETIIDGTLRELKEETKIKVPPAILRGSIVATKTYDDPNRSARGRVITHASLIHFPKDAMLPKVKGADDARRAKWFQLGTLKRNEIFEDHFDIIQDIKGLL